MQVLPLPPLLPPSLLLLLLLLLPLQSLPSFWQRRAALRGGQAPIAARTPDALSPAVGEPLGVHTEEKCHGELGGEVRHDISPLCLLHVRCLESRQRTCSK